MRSVVSLCLLGIHLLCCWSATAHELPAPLVDDLSSFLWPTPETDLPQTGGRFLSHRDLADKVVIITFFDTSCLVTCVIKLLDLGEVARTFSGETADRLAIVAVDLDPSTRTAADLAEFSRSAGLDAAHVTLVATTRAGAMAMMGLIGFVPAPRAPDPVPATLFVFDRRGKLAMRYGGDPVDKRRMVTDIATLAHLADGVGTNNRPMHPSSTISSKGL